MTSLATGYRGALKKNFKRPGIEIYGFFGCQGHGNRSVAEIRASPRQWAIRPTLDSHIPMTLDFFNTLIEILNNFYPIKEP